MLRELPIRKGEMIWKRNFCEKSGSNAAALSVTKKGAQEGMPRLGEIITIK